MKTRLVKAMEAHGVSTREVETLINCQLPTMSKSSKKKIVDKALNDYAVFVQGATAEMMSALALLCNVSTDYLLGLTDSMNQIG